jgi:hypothetical protein
MTTRFSRAATLITALGVGLAAGSTIGCGPDKPPGTVDSCPNDVPRDCPSPAPTYAATVAPILLERCRGCHTAGGLESSRAFDSYDQVMALRVGILFQVSECLMPPANQPQPTAAERQSIMGWVVCGAMND